MQPLTQQQKDELLGRYIFAVSNFLYWEGQRHSEYDKDVQDQVHKWKGRLLKLSESYNAEVGYRNLKDILDELKTDADAH